MTKPILFLFSLLALSSETKHHNHSHYKKNDYELLYCEIYKQAFFVKYIVNKQDVNGKEKRTNKFKSDFHIKRGGAEPSDYVKSGFDRGHLKPAAVSKGSKIDMEESFLMTNISPQLPSFNRIGWKEIEKAVRNLLMKQDSIIVYTGPVLKNINRTIGKNKIGIPNYFYKAILFGDSTKAFAYLCPNKKLQKPYSQYIVSIDSLEKVIEFDLFKGLNEDVESSF